MSQGNGIGFDNNSNLPTDGKPIDAEDKQAIPQNERHISPVILILLLLTVWPVGLVLVFKDKKYYSWIPILLWIFGILILIPNLTLIIFVLPQLSKLYSALNVTNTTFTIYFLIILAIISGALEIIYGFILKKSLLAYQSTQVSMKMIIIAFIFIILPVFLTGIATMNVIAPIYQLTNEIGNTSYRGISVTPSIPATPTFSTDQVDKNALPQIVVNSASMEPTINYQSKVHVDVLGPFYKGLQRGDIVIFQSPVDPKAQYVKRIIAVSGDSIMLKNGQVYLNGKLLDENAYLSPQIKTYGSAYLQEGINLTIPQDSYFVMGDNREHSSDSREWGVISRNKIFDRVVL